MIQEFSFENIFSIKSRQTISFEATLKGNDKFDHFVDVGEKKLLKIAGLFGPNASGKSNMIEAFDYYFWFILNAFSELKPKEDTGFIPFLFDDMTIDKPGFFEIIFYIDGRKYEYQLIHDANCIHQETLSFSPKRQKKLIFERVCENPGEKWGNLIYIYKWGDVFIGAKQKISSMARPNVTFLNTAAQLHHPLIRDIYNWLDEIYLPTITPSQRNILFWTLGKIEKSKTMKKEVLTFLSNAGIKNISDIIIKDKEIPAPFIETIPEKAKAALKNSEGKYNIKETFLTHKYTKNYNLSINDESRGTRRILALAGPLLTIFNNNHFLRIDEIEASLHEGLVEFLLKTFLENSSDSQIIFTTHNQALMDSGLLRDDAIWFVEKKEDGGSVYSRLASYTGVRKDTSRTKLYKAGKFGALPDITDFLHERQFVDEKENSRTT